MFAEKDDCRDKTDFVMMVNTDLKVRATVLIPAHFFLFSNSFWCVVVG